MTTNTIQGLLFDFDGVLSSLEARIGWSFYSAIKHTKPDMKREYVKKAMYKITKQLLNSDKAGIFYPLFSIIRISEIIGFNFFDRLKFMIFGGVSYYKSKMNIVPQPKVNETLAKLSSKYKLGLVTSAERKVIENAKLKIPELKNFQVIITREDYKKTKPDPEGLLMGIDKLGLSTDECVYIGDLPSDITASKKASIKSIAIYGEFEVIGKDSLLKYKPTYSLKYVKDLPKLLEEINE